MLKRKGGEKSPSINAANSSKQCVTRRNSQLNETVKYHYLKDTAKKTYLGCWFILWFFPIPLLFAGQIPLSENDLQLSESQESKAQAFTYFAWGQFIELDPRSSWEKAEGYYLKALKAWPESAVLLRQSLRRWLAQGNFKRIVEEIRPLARDNPEVDHLQIIVSEALRELERFSEAADLLGEAYHGQEAPSPIILRYYSAALWRAGKYNQVNQLLTRARRFPELWESFMVEYSAAIIFKSLSEGPPDTDFSDSQRRQFLKSAIYHARKAVEKLDNTVAPSRIEQLFLLLLDNENYRVAEKLLKISREKLPDDVISLDLKLVSLYQIRQRREEAFALLKELEDKIPASYQGYLQIGNKYLELDAWEKADFYLEQAYKERPDSDYVRFLLAQIKNMQGENEAAYALLEPIEIKSPQIFSLRAHVAYGLKRYEEALELTATARKLAKQNNQNIISFRLYFLESGIYEKLNDVDQALQQAEKAYQLKPDNPEAQNLLGYLLSDYNRQLDRAFILISAAVKATPENPGSRDSLAWVYYRQGKNKKALAEINHTLRLIAVNDFPSNPVILSHAGDIYKANGYSLLAVSFWQLANDINAQDVENLTSRIEKTVSEIKLKQQLSSNSIR